MKIKYALLLIAIILTSNISNAEYNNNWTFEQQSPPTLNSNIPNISSDSLPQQQGQTYSQQPMYYYQTQSPQPQNKPQPLTTTPVQNVQPYYNQQPIYYPQQEIPPQSQSITPAQPTPQGQYTQQNTYYQSYQQAPQQIMIPVGVQVPIRVQGTYDSKTLTTNTRIPIIVASDVYHGNYLVFKKGTPGYMYPSFVQNAKRFGKNGKINIEYAYVEDISNNEQLINISSELKGKKVVWDTSAGFFSKSENISIGPGTIFYGKTTNPFPINLK